MFGYYRGPVHASRYGEFGFAGIDVSNPDQRTQWVAAYGGWCNALVVHVQSPHRRLYSLTVAPTQAAVMRLLLGSLTGSVKHFLKEGSSGSFNEPAKLQYLGFKLEPQ